MTDLTIYTPKQVADILHLNAAYVKVLLRKNEIKGIKFGNRWRIDNRDLAEYIDKKRGAK